MSLRVDRFGPGERDDHERAAAATAPAPAPAPPVGALLQLQRSAGNRAVTAMLARDPDPLLTAPSGQSPEGRKQSIERLGPVDAARAYQQLKGRADASGKSSIDLPDGCFIIDQAEMDALRPLARARKEHAFTDFAARRQPLFDAMTGAADPSARHTAIVKLNQFDQGELPTLLQMQQALGGLWDIDDVAAKNAVLGAIQLEAATDAEGQLLASSSDVHERVWKAAKMGANFDWCGFFAEDHYVRAHMDDDLRAGFFHTNNIEDYFHYVYARNPDRIKKWIWDGDAWQELHAYHVARNAERKWLDYKTLSAGGALDIQPGDTVLVDVGLDGTPNHIVMAVSYDPATNTLVSIGGNDSGLVVVPPGTPKPTDTDDKRSKAEAATGLDLQKGPAGGHVAIGVHDLKATATQRGAIYGVGRPSLVDFEDHIYASQPLDKPPPPLKKK
jgi:hypothetical protein